MIYTEPLQRISKKYCKNILKAWLEKLDEQKTVKRNMKYQQK